jgi:hypothetical protein
MSVSATSAPRVETPLVRLYAAATLVSAALLFAVQPMFAKMVLPLLGGSPAVWNMALVFYQTALLAGYGYAYAVTRWLTIRQQIVMHLVVLLLPLVVLPIGIPEGWTPPTSHSPVPWLLGVLAVSVGLPFFVVSTTSPLLQRWFAASGHASSADPYFLYAASNLGSLVALLGYPALMEPSLRLGQQSRGWAGGYVLLVALIGACGAAVWKTSGAGASVRNDGEGAGERISARRRLRWIVLAAIPASLMLSATTYISTDIAAIPLLWVIPLSLYLLTFVLTFARRPPVPHAVIARVMPIALLVLTIALVAKNPVASPTLIAVHLAAFFITAMACHGELARDRPAAVDLAEFYFWMSLGGVLGGAFNALLAPLLFTDVVEYPLTVLLAALVVPRVAAAASTGRTRQERRQESRHKKEETVTPAAGLLGPGVLDVVLPLLVLAAACGLVALLQDPAHVSSWTSVGIMFGLPALACLAFARRPLRFAAGLGAILLASTLYVAGRGEPVYAERTFFGINRVVLLYSKTHRLLFHGNTMHGAESLDPEHRREPLTYYFANGPLGQFFADFKGKHHTVAAIGLGAGSVACYAQPGQRWTFYEIDPAVARIASDPQYFNFLRDCTPDARIVLGDARLALHGASAGEYDLMVLDAYSSDAIPVHLITREAIRLYLSRLAPGGILMFHLTNRHLDLETVLGNLAADAGLVFRVRHDLRIAPEDQQQGKMASEWAVMTRSEGDLGPLAGDARWVPPKIAPGTSAWTDDQSSVLSAFVWNR